MTTYRERLEELRTMTDDEDCPPAAFRKFAAESNRIMQRLCVPATDPSHVDLDETPA